GVPDSQCWGLEVAGRPKNVGGECVIVRWVVEHVECDSLLAARDDDSRRGSSQFHGISAALALLAGLHYSAIDADLAPLKVHLSFPTAHSSFAAIHPVDAACHTDSREILMPWHCVPFQ